jgi:hypothetical protein
LLTFTWAPTTVALALFFSSRVRAVGPVVMMFASVTIIGGTGFPALASFRPEINRFAVDTLIPLGLTPSQIVKAFVLFGAAVAGTTAWFTLRGLLKRDAEELSLTQLFQSNVVWAFFCTAATLDLSFSHNLPVWFGVAAAPAFGLLSIVLVRLGQRPLQRRPSPRLLILRVFVPGKKAEHLFRFVDTRWRSMGDTFLVAGPDLATQTIKPRFIFDFLLGKLNRLFITGEAQLASRLATIDRDEAAGRGRLYEMYCQGEMWRQAAAAFVARTDVILMDLRGFSTARAGARWELAYIAREFPWERVVLLVDRSTDRNLLAQTLATTPLGTAGIRTVLDAELVNERALWNTLLLTATRPVSATPPPALHSGAAGVAQATERRSP